MSQSTSQPSSPSWTHSSPFGDGRIEAPRPARSGSGPGPGAPGAGAGSGGATIAARPTSVAEPPNATVRILVVEDNPDMAAAIRQGLRENGYSVDIAHKGFEGEEMAVSEPYDLVVLDVMLPDRDGLDVCRNLRRRKVATLILMLTALSGTQAKVAGLDAGADDYLTKPFDFEELLARIRALLRRGTASEATKLGFGDLEMDLIKRRVKREGRKIDLSAKEFALLEFLLRNPERVLDRTTIAQKVWDINYEPASNVIDVYISALRKKIDRDFERPLIHTVLGMGYRFGEAEERASPGR